MLDLLKKLINAQSTLKTGEINAANALADYFEAHGVTCNVDIWDNTRANCTARVASTGEKPALLFAAHLDVVPPGDEEWKFPPFKADQRDGKIFGRGATDMKAGIAATAAAIVETLNENTHLKGDIIFTAAAGEETDACGIKRFIKTLTKEMPPLAGIVIPEPTDFQIVTAHRGILWLKVTTKGKTAHGATPDLGINAITHMSELLNHLKNFKLQHPPHPRIGECSMSINRIKGGNATNVIPDNCSINIDIRTLLDQPHQQIIDQFEDVFSKLKQRNPDFDAKVEIDRSAPAMESDDNSQFTKQFCKTTGIEKTTAVGYTTDASFLQELNVPIAVFGPGDTTICHKPNEYIEIADIEKGKQHLKNIIKTFLT